MDVGAMPYQFLVTTLLILGPDIKTHHGTCKNCLYISVIEATVNQEGKVDDEN